MENSEILKMKSIILILSVTLTCVLVISIGLYLNAQENNTPDFNGWVEKCNEFNIVTTHSVDYDYSVISQLTCRGNFYGCDEQGTLCSAIYNECMEDAKGTPYIKETNISECVEMIMVKKDE